MATYENSITLLKVKDGEDASNIQIKTNQEEILKFYEQDESSSSGKLTITPEILSIELINLIDNSSIEIEDIYFSAISSQGEEFEETLIKEELYVNPEGETENKNIKFIDINKLLNEIFIIEDKYTDTENDDGTSTINETETEQQKNYFLKKNEGFIIFKINNYIKPISCRFGMSDEMAHFSINAASIDAAIQNTKLQFSANGLDIYNGGFQIWGPVEYQETQGVTEKNFNNNQDKFYYEQVNGNYILADSVYSSEKTYYTLFQEKNFSVDTNGNITFKGNLDGATGTFSGTLEAAGGDFTGRIKAIEGEIGGFYIENGKLVSEKTETIIENEIPKDIPYITLDGTNGEIIAKNITLGNGANIEDVINIGKNAFIYNPDKHENLFIKSGNLELTNEGIIKLGENIILNADNNSISGSNWFINSDKAQFSNIDVTGTIHTAVFETGQTQAVGGSMLFKASAKIENIESIKDTEIKVKLIVPENLPEDLPDLFKTGDYVLLDNKQVAKVVESTNETNEESTMQVLTLESLEANQFSNEEYRNITQLMFKKEGDSNFTNNFLIGVNSGDSAEGEFLLPRGITLSELKLNTELSNLISETKVFIGDLKAINENYKGYGLYGNNVYLTGSLVTNIGETYSGINTLNGVVANIFGTFDQSEIVFWAGSASSKETDIQNAPFQITNSGSLYAANGLFKNSIISNSEIRGADIYAATIHGWDVTSNTAGSLSIYDSARGIIFKKEAKDEEVFRIATNGLSVDEENYFITIDETIDFKSDNHTINDTLKVTNIYKNDGNNLTIGDASTKQIIFDDNITIQTSKTNLIKLEPSNINLDSNKIIIQKSNTDIMSIEPKIDEGISSIDIFLF